MKSKYLPVGLLYLLILLNYVYHSLIYACVDMCLCMWLCVWPCMSSSEYMALPIKCWKFF